MAASLDTRASAGVSLSGRLALELSTPLPAIARTSLRLGDSAIAVE